MKILIAASIVLILLLLSLMVGKKNKQTADIYLIVYLCFATFKQAYFYLETLSLIQNSYWMLLGRGVYLLDAPLFFLYIFNLLTSKKLSPKLFTILIFPFAAFFIHFLYHYFFIFDGADLYIKSGLLIIDGSISISWLVFTLMFMIIEPAYLIWFYILLARYKKGLLNAISNQDRVHIQWLYLLFYLLLFITVVLVPLSTLTMGTAWITTDVLQLIIQAGEVVFFFILGYYGFKHTNIFVDFSIHDISEKPKNNGYQKSGLSDAQAKEYHHELLNLMEDQKPYLSGELKAAQLAQLMEISVNHLSQVLNQIQNQHFFDFVNGYRVKHVISKMEDPKFSHYTLLSIALDSGFNSKTSFNTVFKKVMHQTPSHYHKAIKVKAGTDN
ncbi:MAG: helix-turn-helix domain-containing protein [Reichenbachiella sp.]